jgi:hypothetical protein
MDDEAQTLREFIREGWLRMDRAAQRSDRAIDALLRRMDEHHREAVERFARLDAKSDEILAETRAGRQALLAMIDKLNRGDGPAPAG